MNETENSKNSEEVQTGGFDLFGLLAVFGTDINPKECKFHFAKTLSQKTRDGFATRNRFKEFQDIQRTRNFEKKYIVSFYEFGDSWMFSGVWESLGCCEKIGENKKSYFQYETKFVESSAPLERRLVVNWPKRFRNSYPNGKTLADGLELRTIYEEPNTLGRFPGYSSVRLSLQAIGDLINGRQATEWETALKNVPGVYLITDQSNGRLYVGSAYGEEGLWQRWGCYVKTGHGENKKLKEICKAHGNNYAMDNFVISLLWYGGTAVSDEEVISKENFWKDTLRSRDFENYNAN